MAAAAVAVVWEGEVVGRIENPRVDNFHLHGEWVPAGGVAGERFLAGLTTAMARWDEDMAGVSVLVGERDPAPGEVTGYDEGRINVLLGPRLA